MKSNPCDINQKPKPVAEWPDLRSTVVRPVDGKLGDLIVKVLCEVKGFRVEAEAVDEASREDSLRGIPGEKLEPALCVFYAWNGETLDEDVQSLPSKFSIPWLMDAPDGPEDGPRTNGYGMTRIERRHEGRKLFDGS